MTDLDEIKDTLWMYSTHEQHPFQLEEAHAALKDGGDVVIDAMIWGLEQDDVDLKLLVLQLLPDFYPNAKRGLPAVRALISDDEDRLVRVTATNIAHVMGDTSDELTRLLTPRLASEDVFEQIISAANLLRLCRSEDAHVLLRRETTREGSPMAEMAASYLEEANA